MPDILTHVLTGYIVGTLLSLRYEGIHPAHVTLVMIGALSPDVKKIDHLLSDGTVTSALGIPWHWTPLHTLGGSIVVLLLGSLLVAPAHRKRAIALLVVGATTHLTLDLLLIKTSGYAYPVLWPLTSYRPPTGGLYLSSDRWPALVAATVATACWTLRRRQDQSTRTRSRG